MNGKLYVIPSLLGDAAVENSLPCFNIEIIRAIDEYVVEDIRSARRFLIKALKSNKQAEAQNFTSLPFHFHLFNEHSKIIDIEPVIKILLEGKNMGLISEAGYPGVADPGMEIVQAAHKHNIRVVPLVGPSSIIMALAASGLNGQNFTFNGYLPKKEDERKKAIKQLEGLAWQKNQTQIFIETPYRNDSLINSLIEVCRPETLLCIAADITLSTEKIVTMPINDWRRSEKFFSSAYKDHPAVFLIGKNH